jgi:MYXO-CTERM domain-containing protein
MKHVIVILGVAGLEVPAAALGNWAGLEVRLTFDRSTIGIGETATATIVASWTSTLGQYFGALTVDLIASGEFVSVTDVAPVAWNNPALGFDGQGVASGADVIGLNAAQFSLIPPFDPSNPLQVTTFTVVGTQAGLLDYRSRTSQGSTGSYFVVERPNGGPILPPIGDDAFVSQTLVVTPGPGVVGVLGVAGLVGVRRRRG